MGHENKCARPHGHNYIAFFEAHAPDLDGIGRVIDFSVMKERIGGWIDRQWDHGFIVFRDDKEMINALLGVSANKLYMMPTNPTAENMAHHMLDIICPQVLHNTSVKVVNVTIYETENCYATARL
jgi:6-pyruvoyltetrahydropterin/6-carboxytetrahydropterin synthase